jgi:undecaprenyl-phosphate galactose phosphotransferase
MHRDSLQYKNPFWKNIFDKFFALFAIGISLPLMLIISLAIKLTDKGPIFFKQKRIGFRGKPFYVIKFRTMYPDAEKRLKELLEKDPKAREEWEKYWKLKNDPRITPIGKFLRKTSLDELPQFFNVLKGEMSVVGPRPVVEEELKKFYKDKAKYYISVKPGITGYWQVEGRSDIEDYKKRVEMDVWYVKNMSFWLDLKIILKTIWVMLTGKGAY